MTTTSLWFIAALVVLGIELMLGTVYLLAAALGLAAGGLASRAKAGTLSVGRWTIDRVDGTELVLDRPENHQH